MRDIIYLNSYSEHAIQHYRIALKIAQHIFGSVHLVHVYQFYDYLPPTGNDKEATARRQQLTQWIEEIAATEAAKLDQFITENTQKQNWPLVGQRYVLEGGKLEQIEAFLEEQTFDLVIMGLHQQTQLEDIIWSSLAQKLLDSAQAPLLLLPSNVEDFLLSTIVFGTDLGPETEQVLSYLIAWATLFKCRLVLLQIVKNADELAKKQEAFDSIRGSLLLNDSVDLVYMCKIGHPIEVIEYIVETEAADLLVLSTRQRKSWIEHYQQTITKQLARRIKIPLMVLKGQHINEYVIRKDDN